MSSQTRAIMFLLLTATIWGFSFPIGRYALDTISPLALSGFRYAFGALALLPLAWRWRRRLPLENYLGDDHPLLWLKAGLIGGTLMTIGTALQLSGLAHTTAGKAGFLSTLYLLLVPVMAFIIGHIPRLMVWMGLAVGVTGLFLLTGAGGGDSGGFSKSDGLILVSDVFWSFQVLVTGQYALRVNTWLFSCAQAAVCAVQSMILAYFTNSLPTWHDFVVTLPATAWGVLSVGLAFSLQTMAQRYTSAASAALILPLQAVVGAAAGVVFLGEKMSAIMIVGAGVLLSGSLLAQFAKEPIRIDRDHKHSNLFLVLRIMTGTIIGGGALGLSIWAVV